MAAMGNQYAGFVCESIHELEDRRKRFWETIKARHVSVRIRFGGLWNF